MALQLRLLTARAGFGVGPGFVALPATLAGGLLAHLALRGRPVPRQELALWLWPHEAEREALRNLREQLRRLRQWIAQQGLGGCLEVTGDALGVTLDSDAARLHAAHREGRAQEALALYQSPLLEGWVIKGWAPLHEWIAQQRRELHAAWRACVLAEARRATERGDGRAVLPSLLQLLDAEPLAEDVLQRLLALPNVGDGSVAVHERYRRFCDDLGRELGCTPMAETEALARALGNGTAAAARRPDKGAASSAAPGANEGLAAALPAPAALRLPPPLVGRGEECEWLRQLPPHQMAWISGAAGSGKTLLLHAALPEASWLRCREGLMEVPLHPVAELLLQHKSRLLAQSPHLALEWARLVPRFAADSPPPIDAALGKARFFDALTQALLALPQPVVVDDVQWADATTLDWLAAAAVDGRVRFVFLVREAAAAGAAEALDAPRWAALQRSLARDGRLAVRALPPLPPAQVHELLAHFRRHDRAARGHGAAAAERASGGAAGGAAEGAAEGAAAAHEQDLQPLAQWLTGAAAGNAWMVMELLRAWFEAGTLALDAQGRWQGIETLMSASGVLPQRVLDVARARFAHLSGVARRLLDVACLVSGPLPPADELAGLCALTPQATAGAVEELEAAGLLHAGQFAHDLHRQAAAALVPGVRATQSHRRIAQALAAAGADPAQIALHWLQAGEPGQARRCQLRAAQRLNEQGAHEAARRLLAEVEQAGGEPDLRLHAQAMQAEALLLTDLAAGLQALQQVLAQVPLVPHGPARDALELRLHTALADNGIYRGDMAGSLAHVEAMQPLLDSTDGDERIHALEIVSEVAMRVGRYDTAHAALRRARREAPQRVTLQVCEAMLALHELRLDRALPLFDHLVRHHPEHGRYYTTENDYAVALHLRGDLAAAEHWIRRGLSTWAGVVHAQCLSNLNLASIVGSAGRWDEAHAALQRALALAREHASPLFEGEAWHRLARLYLQAGRAPSARAALEEAFALLSAGGDALRLAQWRAQAAIVAVAEGDLAAAAQHQAQARALLGDAPGMLARLRVMRADVYLARASGEHARAAQQAQALAEASEARGLDELRVESLLLQASVEAACPALRPGRPGAAELARRAQALAAQRGMLEWQWRAAELCGHLEPGAQAQAACRPLRERLFACVTVVADAEAALQLLPGLPHPRGD